MIVIFVLVLVLLVGLTAAAVMGRIGGSMAEATSSRAFVGLPRSPSADDVAELHLDQALRGYRMDQVDEVIDALSARLRELESEVASLRGTNVSRAADIPDAIPSVAQEP